VRLLIEEHISALKGCGTFRNKRKNTHIRSLIMATIQGIVDINGTIIRRQGLFSVVSKSSTTLVVRVPNRNLMNAFVLATPWRNDTDIGAAGVAASPNPHAPDQMIFAVDGIYGVSFRILTT
jgi:hypothetical protein